MLNFDFEVQVMKRKNPLGEKLDLVHATLGMVSEVGEIHQALGDPLNLLEESGDFMWFACLGLVCSGETWNNATLRMDDLKKDDRLTQMGNNNLMLALTLVAADLADINKKHIVSGKPLDAGNYQSTIVAGLALVEELARRSGFTREQILVANEAKLNARHKGQQYNPDNFENRDKDKEMGAIHGSTKIQ